MANFGPISRADLIKNLRKLGFSGPYAGGKHETMRKGRLKLILPNPHQSDIGVDFLKKILKQAEISREEWEKL